MKQQYYQKQKIQNAQKILRVCCILLLVVVFIGVPIYFFYLLPSNQPVSDFISSPLLFVSIAILIIIFIIFYILGTRILSRKKDWLQMHGQTVQAVVTKSYTKIDTDSRSEMHYLDLQWQNSQTGKTYKFSTSSSSRSILRPIGTLVPVLIDPDDPTFYHIDS